MAPDVDSYQLPELESRKRYERYETMDDIIGQAHREGVIPVLPESAEEAARPELLQSRIRTVRTRMYLLGYLSDDNESGEIDAELQGAIRVFQTDAEITIDGWVGEETWTALQELVSFEEPTNLKRWMADGEPKRALRNAVKLRLHALGFLKNRFEINTETVEDALHRFAIITRALRLTPKFLLPQMSIDTLDVLFDQDNIVTKLAEAGPAYTYVSLPEIENRVLERRIRAFVICVSKIELWLLGYDVRPDGDPIYEPPASFPYAAKDNSLFHALAMFWEANGHKSDEARDKAGGISGEFFQKLKDIEQQADKLSSSEYSEKLLPTLLEQPPALLDQVWSTIKSIGSRIWDGIKRAWRWLKSLISRGVRLVASWVKNLARIAYGYAVSAFAPVIRIARILIASVKFFLNETIPGSDVDHIVIRHDSDFDFSVFVNRFAMPNRIQAVLSECRRQAAVFSLGTRILGTLIDTVIHVVRSLVVPVGWFGLILSLVRVYNELKALKLLSVSEEQLLTWGVA